MRMTRHHLLPPLLVALAAAAAGCASDEQLSVEEGAGVEIVDFAFEPAAVEVASGEPAEWLNRDPIHHTVTADDGSFDSGQLNQGERFMRTFEKPGEYPYHCEIHPSMRGTVRVLE